MKNYQEIDEKLYTAVEKLKKGDMDSYYIMYDLSVKYIYKIIYDIVRDYHITEDLVQKTYLSIYTNILDLKDIHKFYPWAGRIATNKALRYIQKNKRELLLYADEDYESDTIFDYAYMDKDAFIPETFLADLEKQSIISDIIENLSTSQKLTIQFYYYEEMSMRTLLSKSVQLIVGCMIETGRSCTILLPRSYTI